MKQRLELTWFNKDKALIPTEQGRYGYIWVSPNDPRYCETHTLIKTDVITGTQLPKVAESTYSERANLEPQSGNLLICGESGDALEALTRVPELAEKYVGKVKCVYIDPPFNTAQTFVNYEDNLEHSVWLTMMRDRLIHLRNLLSEDGSIWVHLDDMENHRMRVLLDEVFGASNFQAEVVWQKADSGRNDAKGFSADHDVLLVYGKSSLLALNRMPRSAAEDARFTNPDGDKNGVWFSADRTAPGSISGKMQHPAVFGIEHPITHEMFYPAPGRHWTFGQDRILSSLREYGDYILSAPDKATRVEKTDLPESQVRDDVMDLRLAVDHSPEIASQRIQTGNWPEFFATEASFGRKSYPPKQGQPPRTWWTNDEVGHNRAAKSEIKTLFPQQTPFATPKPERLLERIIHISTLPGDLVLDVFAGSGTTPAVAQKMGRRWIAVELVPETFDRFILPRLEKVVNGEDLGGVTITAGERADDTVVGLPEGLTAEDAQRFTSLLKKVVANRDDLKKDATVKTLRELTKTKKTPDTINWRGGGGFTVAKLSPTCFDYNEELDLVTLTEHATGQTLIDSVAAQLRFYLTPNDRHFHGQVGIQHLVVIEGVLDNEKVDDLMSHLPQGHCLVVAATIINEETRDHVRSFKNGSRVVSIPHDLFTYSKNQEVR